MKSYWIEHKGKWIFCESLWIKHANGPHAKLEEAIKGVLIKEPFNSWHRFTFLAWLTVSSKCLSGSACGLKIFSFLTIKMGENHVYQEINTGFGQCPILLTVTT